MVSRHRKSDAIKLYAILLIMVQGLLFVVVLVFGIASYIVGVREIWRGSYRPSVFSRAIWLLLAINSFAGVIASQGTRGSVLLAAILLVGNAAICAMSVWKGTRTFGRLEMACLALLSVSAFVWMRYDVPLINLGLSLFAHFIGALPTIRRVLLQPSSESTEFWALFFIASCASVAMGTAGNWQGVLLPVYFMLFDGTMMALSLRKSKY